MTVSAQELRARAKAASAGLPALMLSAERLAAESSLRVLGFDAAALAELPELAVAPDDAFPEGPVSEGDAPEGADGTALSAEPPPIT